MRLLTFLSTLALMAGAASAQEHALNDGPFDFARIEQAIAMAHSAGDSEFQASAPDPRQSGNRGRVIAVTRDGVPVLAYRPSTYDKDGRQPDVTFSCGPDRTVDITQVLSGLGGGAVPPRTARLALSIKPYGQDEFVMPVTLIETLDAPYVLIRVHGRIPADSPFLRDLRATSNLQVQLMADGRYERLDGGGDLSTFQQDVRPLLDLCAGGAAAPAPRAATASAWTPDAAEIKAALEARIAQQMRVYDGMADQCNNLRNDNPVSALACMMSGFGMASSQNMGVTIHGVDLGECVRADDATAYCRYRVDAQMRGQGTMGQVADLANLGLSLGAWSYGGFEHVGGSWSLIRSYEHCAWGNGKINCTYRE
ncbi:MAG: hypothetical protein QM682_12905 [Paracoccus sp. (in: a-proteobacteria)]|uniref:hypothetical protein n=1 Tax=Paracoccus sp. TaxID=267 RepID=UPI0039E68A4D